MAEPKRKHRVSRQRGYLPADPSLPIEIIDENEAAPLNADGSVMRKLWDIDIETSTVVTQHVEPGEELPPESVPV